MVSIAVRIATAILLLCPMTLDAFSQSPPGAPTPQAAPISPGGLRITARNPLQGNWLCKGNVCTCKPLACAAESSVSYSTVPTPARSPDPQALEKFAKVEVPKRVMAANAAQNVLSDGKDKFEMITTKVSRYHGFPSVLSETKFIKDKASVFITSAMIFAGPSLLTVRSISPDRAVAMKSLNEFIQAMTIEEGPPLNSNAAPRSPPVAPVAPPAPARPSPSLREI
jgi:hypothetical protein